MTLFSYIYKVYSVKKKCFIVNEFLLYFKKASITLSDTCIQYVVLYTR